MSGLFARAREVLEELSALDNDARQERLERIEAESPELHAEVSSLLPHLDRDESELKIEDIPVSRAALEGVLDSAKAISDPSQVGRYRILKRVGAGGMGVVYLAEQDSPKRTVALKMLRPSSMRPTSVRRFRQESELLGRLQHPGIAQVFEAGMVDLGDGSQPYFAMEFVEGLSLTQHANEHDLGPRERLKLFIQVCDAVQHAHERGVVHRDIKPDNVLVQVQREPRVKVLDFGVARATDSDQQLTTLRTGVNSLIGTLPYMSPEQVRGDSERAEATSDVYALGALLYELLTGELPLSLQGHSIAEAARVICDDPPRRPSLISTSCRGDLDTIIAKALEKDPERRYPSSEQLADDLRRYLANQPILARPASALYRVRRFAQRRPAWVLAPPLALIGTILGLFAGARLLAPTVNPTVSPTANPAPSVVDAEQFLEIQRYAEDLQRASTLLGLGDDLEAIELLRKTRDPDRDVDTSPETQGRFERLLLERKTPIRGPVFPLPMPTTAHVIWPSLNSEGVANSPRVATARAGKVLVFDPLSGTTLFEIDPPAGHSVSSLSADGSRLITRKAPNSVAWEMATGESLHEFQVLAQSGPELTPDGTQLVYAGTDGSIQLRELGLNREQTLHKADPASVGWIKLTPTGRTGHLLVHIDHRSSKDELITFDLNAPWERRSDIRAHRIYDGKGSASTISQSGELVSIRGLDGGLRILDLADLRTLHEIPIPDATHGGAFLPGSRHILSMHPGVGIRRWPLPEELWTNADRSITNHPSTSHLPWGADMIRLPLGPVVNNLTISPDGHLALVVRSDNRSHFVALWRDHAHDLGITPGVSSLQWSATGSAIVAIIADGKRHAWDLANGEPIPLAEAEPLDATTFGGPQEIEPSQPFFDHGPSGRRVAFENNSLLLSDLNTGALLHSQPCRPVTSVAFDPAGKRIAVGHNDGRIAVYDANYLQLLLEFEAHESSVDALSFNPDGTYLASLDRNGAVRIW